MKRFLGVMVLGLLWCNVGFAKCIVGNCSNGQGTFSYHNGDIYVGGYKYGQRHGQGTFTRVDGKVEKGNWEYNELQSTFTKIWENGEMILVQILRFGFLF